MRPCYVRAAVKNKNNDPGILVINVGSTSMKMGFFKGTKPAAEERLTYESAPGGRVPGPAEQLEIRQKDFFRFAGNCEGAGDRIDIVASRGGLMRPGPAGIYEINEKMCEDLRCARYGLHASALGPPMALAFGRSRGIKAVIADPPSTDEFSPVARISGLSGIERKSAIHALNQKAAARKAAARLGRNYEDINLVVAHLGGGITVGAHRKGRVIDSTHGLNEGPFTPERAGSLPLLDLVELACAKNCDREAVRSAIIGAGGLVSYFGTASAERVEDMIRTGDRKARLIYRAMAYQIAKDVGAMAAVLKGKVDGIVLTGGLAHSKRLVRWIGRDTMFIAPVFVFAGEDEMKALAKSAMRVLAGEAPVRRYR